jgi:hypothetical protein
MLAHRGGLDHGLSAWRNWSGSATGRREQHGRGFGGFSTRRAGARRIAPMKEAGRAMYICRYIAHDETDSLTARVRVAGNLACKRRAARLFYHHPCSLPFVLDRLDNAPGLSPDLSEGAPFLNGLKCVDTVF